MDCTFWYSVSWTSWSMRDSFLSRPPVCAYASNFGYLSNVECCHHTRYLAMLPSVFLMQPHRCIPVGISGFTSRTVARVYCGWLLNPVWLWSPCPKLGFARCSQRSWRASLESDLIYLAKVLMCTHSALPARSSRIVLYGKLK